MKFLLIKIKGEYKILLGNVIYHKFLIPKNLTNYEVLGGGHCGADEDTIVFLGSSVDYGEVKDLELLKKVILDNLETIILDIWMITGIECKNPKIKAGLISNL